MPIHQQDQLSPQGWTGSMVRDVCSACVSDERIGRYLASVELQRVHGPSLDRYIEGDERAMKAIRRCGPVFFFLTLVHAGVGPCPIALHDLVDAILKYLLSRFVDCGPGYPVYKRQWEGGVS